MKKITLFTLFLILTNLYSQNNIDESLKLHYTFNNDSFNQVSNQNHAVTVGGQYVNDRFDNTNSAYQLIGDKDWIEFPSTKDLWENNWTYSIWFKLDILPSSVDDAFLLTYKDISFGDDVHLYVDDDDNKIKIFFESTSEKVSSGVTITEDLWYNASIVTLPNETRLYINGEFKASTSNKFTSTYSDNNFIISSNFSGDTLKGRVFGAIDDVRFYDSALSDNDILNIFKLENNEESLSIHSVVINNVNKKMIFPNPTIDGYTNIVSENKIENITIFDNLGRTVKSLINTNNKLNVSDLSKGVYFLKLENKIGVSQNEKLIIN